MQIAVDYDGTLVDDLGTWIDGAREGLYALVRAGHVLVLYSARANRALRFNPELDPLLPPLTDVERLALQEFSQARYNAMVEDVRRTVPGLFAYVDDGAQGKPTVDLFLDDRAVRITGTWNGWRAIALRYGVP